MTELQENFSELQRNVTSVKVWQKVQDSRTTYNMFIMSINTANNTFLMQSK
ncbi:MAG: hypothetical protein ISR65_14140 [Bacteriovoracaceae bacterium]|nr:hypothetical protein [Bacteriovoracaceae bacterium]